MSTKTRIFIRLFAMFCGLMIFGAQAARAQLIRTKKPPDEAPPASTAKKSFRLQGMASGLEGLVFDERADFQLYPVLTSQTDKGHLYADLYLGSVSLGGVFKPILGIKPSIFLNFSPDGGSSSRTIRPGWSGVSSTQRGSGEGQANFVFGSGGTQFALSYGFSLVGSRLKVQESTTTAVNQQTNLPANPRDRSYVLVRNRDSISRKWDISHSVGGSLLFEKDSGSTIHLAALWRLRLVENWSKTDRIDEYDYDPDGDGLYYLESIFNSEILTGRTYFDFETKPSDRYSLIWGRIHEVEVGFLASSSRDQRHRWRTMARLLYVVSGDGRDSYVDGIEQTYETVLGNTYVTQQWTTEFVRTKPFWVEGELGLGLEWDGKKRLLLAGLRYRGVVEKQDLYFGESRYSEKEYLNGSKTLSTDLDSSNRFVVRERTSAHNLILSLGLEYYVNNHLTLRGGVQGRLTGVWIQGPDEEWATSFDFYSSSRLGMGYRFSESFLMNMYVSSSLTTLSSYALSGSLSF